MLVTSILSQITQILIVVILDLISLNTVLTFDDLGIKTSTNRVRQKLKCLIV